jgi:hypothetical protein
MAGGSEIVLPRPSAQGTAVSPTAAFIKRRLGSRRSLKLIVLKTFSAMDHQRLVIAPSGKAELVPKSGRDRPNSEDNWTIIKYGCESLVADHQSLITFFPKLARSLQ